jgi:hypothetical protein
MDDLKKVAVRYKQSKKRSKKEKMWSKGMREFKAGKMRSGKDGKVVKDMGQAKAIILSKVRRGEWK